MLVKKTLDLSQLSDEGVIKLFGDLRDFCNRFSEADLLRHTRLEDLARRVEEEIEGKEGCTREKLAEYVVELQYIYGE